MNGGRKIISHHRNSLTTLVVGKNTIKISAADSGYWLLLNPLSTKAVQTSNYSNCLCYNHHNNNKRGINGATVSSNPQISPFIRRSHTTRSVSTTRNLSNPVLNSRSSSRVEDGGDRAEETAAAGVRSEQREAAEASASDPTSRPPPVSSGYSNFSHSNSPSSSTSSQQNGAADYRFGGSGGRKNDYRGYGGKYSHNQSSYSGGGGDRPPWRNGRNNNGNNNGYDRQYPITSNSCCDERKPSFVEIRDYKLKENEFRPIELITRRLHNQLFNLEDYGDHRHVEFGSSEVGFELSGSDISEHFENIASKQAEGYHQLLKQSASETMPPVPEKWEFQAGWTRYDAADGSLSSVSYPSDPVLAFDVEVCCKESEAPILACAVSTAAWYCWVSPALVDSKNHSLSLDEVKLEQLIPLEDPNHSKEPRIVIGHNVSYDRIRVREQYSVAKSGVRYWDTMAMHIAIRGLTGDQKNIFLKAKKDSAADSNSGGAGDGSASKSSKSATWTNNSYGYSSSSWLEGKLDRFSNNSLAAVHALEFPDREALDKDKVKTFVNGTLDDIREDFQNLVNYCAEDCRAAHEIMVKMWPAFEQQMPSPVTLFGMLEMSTTVLPINQNWLKYVSQAEAKFKETNEETSNILKAIMFQTLDRLSDDKKYNEDIWMWSERWDLKKKKLAKGADKTQPAENETEVPHWFRELCPNSPQQLDSAVPDEITARKHVRCFVLCGYPNVVPKLLRMTWGGYPLFHSRKYGWGYLVPDPQRFRDNYKEIFSGGELSKRFATGDKGHTFTVFPQLKAEKGYEYVFPFRMLLKHMEKVGMNNKHFDHNPACAVQSGILKPYPVDGEPHGDCLAAKLSSNLMATAYWTSTRSRINAQIPVWKQSDKSLGYILPNLCTAGTITRRATEPTWLTASRYEESRIGSELRECVVAEPGYCFVGADVDSEEQWIAALLGDYRASAMELQTVVSYDIQPENVGCVGMNEFSWAFLNGSRSDGTDHHSMVARSIGINRDQAKVLNYARLYGSGLKHIQVQLKKWMPSVEQRIIDDKAVQLFRETKGRMLHGKYYGGSESHVFNKLEEIVKGEDPKTPVLRARISESLKDTKSFMPSRVNWVVQSSGVDFLHLLLTSMNDLIQRYDIDARFILPLHDEVRYQVKLEDRYRAGLALQLSNLFARAMFSHSLRIPFIPASIAYFSSVDFDLVLRKEPKTDSASNKDLIIPQDFKFESIPMADIMKLTGGSLEKKSSRP